MDPIPSLSRREREIMEIIFAARQATLSDIQQRMQDAPTRPALRSLLTILENKGHLTHTKRAREFVYQPAQKTEKVARSAFGRLLDIFFNGSLTNALASYLNDPKAHLSAAELEELSAFVEAAKQRGATSRNGKSQAPKS